jgi:hypothetical protein
MFSCIGPEVRGKHAVKQILPFEDERDICPLAYLHFIGWAPLA